MAVTDAQSVDAQLAWEKRTRPRAAAIAGLSGMLVIGGLVVAGVTTQDQPSALLLDSLRNLEADGPIGDQTTVHVTDFMFSSDKRGGVLASILMLAAGLLGIGLTIAYLGRVTKARRPQMPRFAMPLPAVGATIAALGIVTVYFAQQGWHDDILAGSRTVDAVRERPAGEGVGYAIELLGLFAFALGTVLVSLNAMRTGLLTRTMGILGMFAGGAVVLFGPSQPLLPLWTIFLAPLFLGRWMGGQPPAWASGKEEPWPSSAELRQDRMDARAERLQAKGKLAAPDPTPVEERAAERTPHPSSKKRKRKKELIAGVPAHRSTPSGPGGGPLTFR